MQAQSYPPGYPVPSDEALMISLYQQLLRDRWKLLYMPLDDRPDEYGLPSSLTGNSIVSRYLKLLLNSPRELRLFLFTRNGLSQWLQRKRDFFRSHRGIRERDVFVAHRGTFFDWIQTRFRPGIVGTYGATQNLCLVYRGHVFWIDRMAARVSVYFYTYVKGLEGRESGYK